MIMFSTLPLSIPWRWWTRLRYYLGNGLSEDWRTAPASCTNDNGVRSTAFTDDVALLFCVGSCW